MNAEEPSPVPSPRLPEPVLQDMLKARCFAGTVSHRAYVAMERAVVVRTCRPAAMKMKRIRSSDILKHKNKTLPHCFPRPGLRLIRHHRRFAVGRPTRARAGEKKGPHLEWASRSMLACKVK